MKSAFYTHFKAMPEFSPHRECKEPTCYLKKYCVDAACLDRDIDPINLPLLTFDWIGILEGRINAYSCKHKDAQEARKRVREVISRIPTSPSGPKRD